MRSISPSFIAAAALVGVVAFAACAAQVRNPEPAAPANCQPLPSASADAALVSNSTSLTAEALPSPISQHSVYFGKPELAEEIPLEAAPSYEVRLLRDRAGEEDGPIDVALDDGRPRRLSASQSALTLTQLLAADAELSPGAHWLFAAPVLASGLVPRKALSLPRAGIARRFFIGKPPPSEPGPTGAIWLRKPEGTYNGAEAAAHVLFDVFVFSASGAPVDVPYTVTLHGLNSSGDLRLPSPFSVYDLASGEYQVTVSSLAAKTLSTRFVVNRELGATP